MNIIVHNNKIPSEKRIILNDSCALSLVSFHQTDPEKVIKWFQQGKRPVLWDLNSWELIKDTKWKTITNSDNTVEYVEAMVL